MKNKTMLKILFLSIVLSSCGLIERFKTPDQPTDSNEVAAESTANDELAQSPDATDMSADTSDDLFTKTLEEAEANPGKDAPTNVASAGSAGSAEDEDLKSLEDEFSSAGPKETVIRETPIAQAPAKTQEAPVIVEEAFPEIKPEVAEVSNYNQGGAIKSYRVHKGETLMQIAFKIYGDTSKWKELRDMNAGRISNNSSLKANTELQYRAPAREFVWNPSGTPYLIKTGETLGTISNAVYATPKKWKVLWHNNKPLIKNPNIIYAGFTIYYANSVMGNYVQPKSVQPKVEVEEIMVAEEVKAKIPEVKAEVVPVEAVKTAMTKDEEQIDEAIQSLSAPERSNSKEKEIDLINNISVPRENMELAPDIDEELQTLE